MPLFQVPGWSVPGSPPTETPSSKKRKRRTSDESTPSQLSSKLGSAQINFDKLVHRLGVGSSSNTTRDSGDGTPKRKPSKKEAKKARKVEEKKNMISLPMKLGSTKGHVEGPSSSSSSRPQSRESKRRGERERPKMNVTKPTLLERTKSAGSERPAKRAKRRGASESAEEEGEEDKDESTAVSSQGEDQPTTTTTKKDDTIASSRRKHQREETTSDDNLTPLQKKMKSNLDGSRFRLINETLYKSDSKASHQLLKSNPQVFNDYHTGFRHQVLSWPTNPLTHYISSLSSYPPKTLVADFGCGEAQLAKTLILKGLNVLSYDLVGSDYVTEADICQSVPLPGSLDTSGAGIVDVVVCALALMSTNWVGCIREARRVLRDDGELKIAEVASRFTDVKEFIDVVKSVGFKLVSKDDSNTHFTIFEFVKIKTKTKSSKEWDELMKRGGTLKACEYKRR